MWNEITPSGFPWERAALDHVRRLLPGRHPYQAWTNFTFVSNNGHVREVDLLVAAPSGLHLVEIKSFKGRLSNQGSTWILDDGRRHPPFDSPVHLADLKAKELKSLLQVAARGEKLRFPYVKGSIFLSERGMRADLSQQQRHHLYGPEGNAAGLPDIADLLLAPPPGDPLDPQFARRLHDLLRKVGIHRTQKSISLGPWRIDPQPYESGPTWQDHHARRPDDELAYRRARIYLYERQDDRESRESVQLAAQREFTAGRGIEHPGLLMPVEKLDHEMGPALLIVQSEDARRLDHWLVEHPELSLPDRLGLIRQLAEAVGYAHGRRLVHRALSPRAVIVETDDGGALRLRVGEWQVATRGLSSSSTRHRVEVTSHAGRHVDPAAQGYLAPEFTEDADSTTAIDIFGLGSTSYLILTGKAPASTGAELIERLLRDGGLHPAAVDDSLPDDVDQVVATATAPVVSDRFDDVDGFLEWLNLIEENLRGSVHPDPGTDPYEAGPGDVLGGEYEVLRLLGTGATSRALLVRRDEEESVLKVGRDDRAVARLDDESAVLTTELAHPNIVQKRRGVFELGNRTALEVSFAGDHTLAHVLKTEGALLPDLLQRYGSQLLDALAHLERTGVRHRDIKPDNIGVLVASKKAARVVLFDFSLAGVPDTDITAGTRGYRDPFLGTARRPRWDAAAERYGAAVTLHEMASRELPSWGDDGTDPRVGDAEASISEEVFDAGLREPLAAFFRRTLARDADQRFDSADAMRRAWDDVFARVDSTGPATTLPSYSDDPQDLRDRAAEHATLDTALSAAGLSVRAVAVAQRLGAETVGDLIELPDRTLWFARGSSRVTRAELAQRAAEWRARLLGAPEGGHVAEPRGDGEPASLDLVVRRLLPEPQGRGPDRVAITRRALGLPDDHGVLPPERWPTTKDLVDAFGLTVQRTTQILGTQRARWRSDDEVVRLRSQVIGVLRGLGRVATARELADQLLTLRGCPTEEDPERRRAHGYAVLRAAVEGDDPDDPHFETRRHHDGHMLLALQVGLDEGLDVARPDDLLGMAAALGDAAVDLAEREPLPTPASVVRELGAVAASFSSGLAEQRLVQLAASTSGTVLANARLELYPADLSPERALRLSQAGSLLDAQGLPPEVFAARVAARFPGLPTLPDGAELARLLRSIGVQVEWTGERVRPLSTHTGTSSRIETPLPARAGADPRLDRVLEYGGVRIVTVRRSSWAAARVRIAAATGARVHDAGAEFAGTMREVADERGVRSFSTVLRADDEEAPARARTNLAKLAGIALERLEERWRAEPVLVLDGLTPFGRYDGAMAVLERLMSSARGAGRDGGPTAVVLLCTAADEQVAPHVDHAAIGMVSAEEWLVATQEWLAGADAA